MQSLRFKSQKSIRAAHVVIIFAIAAGISPAAAEATLERLGKAVPALGAAGVGVGYARRFISFRNGDTWSAPGAITLESDSWGAN